MKNILFLGIETVTLTPTWEELPEALQEHWLRKAYVLKGEEDIELLYQQRASAFAEFGKVVCIGLGGWDRDGFHLSCLHDHDEGCLLNDFIHRVEKHPAGQKLVLCAHNGKEFDFPYLCRRMLINGLALPNVLNISGKKPWEIPHKDTLEMWKFGDRKIYTSLGLMSAVLGIPTASMSTFEKRALKFPASIQELAATSMEKVLAMARVYARLAAQAPIVDEAVIRNRILERN
jgi:hypothetical protein